MADSLSYQKAILPYIEVIDYIVIDIRYIVYIEGKKPIGFHSHIVGLRTQAVFHTLSSCYVVSERLTLPLTHSF